MSKPKAVPPRGESAMPGIVAVVRQLVAQGFSPARACGLCASAVGAAWGGSSGPAAIEADPTAYPVDRAILRALGYDVPSERPLAVALGLDQAAEPAEES